MNRLNKILRSRVSAGVAVSAIAFAAAFFIISPPDARGATASIRDYGAKCDGSNDAAAIQNALNQTASNDTLVFDCVAGVGSMLSIGNKSGVTLTATNGGGLRALNDYAGQYDAMIIMQNCTDCVIDGLDLNGNRKRVQGLAVFDSLRPIIRNNRIYDIGSGYPWSTQSQPAAAISGNNNTSPIYSGNTVLRTGFQSSDGVNNIDSTRGIWVGQNSGEINPVISNNTFSDLAGTAIVIGWSGTATVNGNSGTKLGWSMVKSLGKNGSILNISNMSSSGAGARGHQSGGLQLNCWWTGVHSTKTNITNSFIDTALDSGIYVTGPGCHHELNFEGSTIQKAQNGGIRVVPNEVLSFKGLVRGSRFLQSDAGLDIFNGNGISIENSYFSGNTMGVHLLENGAWPAQVDNITLSGNSYVSNGHGLYVHHENGGWVGTVSSLSNNCYSSNSASVYDQRGTLSSPSQSSSCSDPTIGTSNPPLTPSDTTPPSVSITFPSNGATVSNTLTVSASASDNVGVAKVEFYVDGSLKATDTSSPYSYSWNTSGLSNSSHSLTAKAYDAANNSASSQITVNVNNTVLVSDPSVPIRINMGGTSYTDTLGNVWLADPGGSTGFTDSTTSYISGTSEQKLYQSSRWNYDVLDNNFSVPNGSYYVTLKFAELYFSTTNRRVMNVDINSQRVLTGFDIVASAGGANKAVDRTFPVTVTNGQIAIHLTATVDEPQINAIEIVPVVTSPTVVCPSPATNAFTGCYYKDTSFSTLGAARTDSQINFDWGNGSPDPAIPVDNFSARWQGNFGFEAGDYEFAATVDDGVRLYVDNQLIIDKWIDQPPTTYTATKSLTAGNHLIKMEYYEKGVGAVAKLSWKKTASAAPADTTPPTVYITSPTAGATVSGTVAISASASDNTGVAQVELYIDGALKATDTSAPYSFSWNTIGLNDGTHTISAKAYDPAGNQTTSAAVSVTVKNTTTPTITCPAPAANAFTGCYYSGTALSNLVLSRTDSQINFDWGSGSPDSAVPADNFSARWEGNFNFNSGSYDFAVTTDDGARLYIDNLLVLDKWLDQAPTTYTAPRTLSAGNHLVRLEYYEKSGGAVAKLSWNQASAPLPGDTTAPVISAITASGITRDSATISWVTNEPASSQVEYGKTTSYGQSTILNQNLQTSHLVALNNLSKGTTYHYRVKSADQSGNLSVSSDQTFTTLTRTAKPAKVSNLSASAGSVILSWTNPDYEYVNRIEIYRSTSGYVQTPVSSARVAQLAPNATTWRDVSVSSGTKYYYTVFTVDDQNKYSDPESISFQVKKDNQGKVSISEVSMPPSSGGGSSLGSSAAASISAQTSASGGSAATAPGQVSVSGPGGALIYPNLPPLTITLSYRMEGGEVATLQKFLVNRGYLPQDTPLGYFGPLTREAVRKYHCDNGIACSGDELSTGYGQVGAQTRALINSQISGGTGATVQVQTMTNAELLSLISELLKQVAVLQEKLKATGR